MKRQSSKILWITDPWITLDHPEDTTLRIIQEGFLLGIPQFWCDVKSIRLKTGRIFLDAHLLLGVEKERTSASFKWKKSQLSSPQDFSSIHYRPDPPVDNAYLHPLHLLNLGLQNSKKTEVINPLEVLVIRNEKMEASALGKIMPPSIVSSQWEHLYQFGKTQGRTVLKPLHEAQSHGIELLDWQHTAGIEIAREKLSKITQGFNTPIILQTYLEGIQNGETRLWFLNGKLLAHARRMPLLNDFRVNMDRGSQMVQANLTRREFAAVSKISKHLKASQIRLAAVDLIEGFLTDFNFTSPGLIVQMEKLLGTNLAKSIALGLVKRS